MGRKCQLFLKFLFFDFWLQNSPNSACTMGFSRLIRRVGVLPKSCLMFPRCGCSPARLAKKKLLWLQRGAGGGPRDCSDSNFIFAERAGLQPHAICENKIAVAAVLWSLHPPGCSHTQSAKKIAVAAVPWQPCAFGEKKVAVAAARWVGGPQNCSHNCFIVADCVWL